MTTVKKAKNIKADDIKILNYTLIQNDRTIKRIEDWRTALKAAENVYNPKRWYLYNIYEELILDPHLTAVSEKRKLNVLKSDIKFLDANGKEDDAITKIIAMPFFRQMCFDILDKVSWGKTVCYFDHFSMDSVGYNLIPRKHLIPEKTMVIKAPFDDEGINWMDPVENKYILEAGLPKDFGLINRAAPYVIFKKNVIQDWSTYDEVYGFPFRKFTYDGTDLSVKTQLENIAKSTFRAPWAVMPREAELEIIQNIQNASSSDIFEKLAKFCDEQVSKLYLGNTLTTDAKGGQYKGAVHENGELRVAENDSYSLLAVLNTEFIKILENFGIKCAGGSFILEDRESQDLTQLMGIDKWLASFLPLSQNYFYETYGKPMPKAGEELIDIASERIEVTSDKSEVQPVTDPSKSKDKVSLSLKWKDRILSFFAKAPKRG